MIKRIKAFSKAKKITLAAIAVVLCAAIVFGGITIHRRSAYFCQYAKPFAFSEVEGNEAVTLVAHRGAAVDAPENTLPAYEIAAKKGYRFAETDIRATADGTWVLSHDNSLKRMTGFSGKVESMRLEEVRAHKITEGANIKDYPDLYTPTYEEFLLLCKEKKLNPVIEIKTEPLAQPAVPYRSIVDLLAQYGLLDTAVIISFHAGALQSIRDYNKAVKLQYLVKELDEEVFTTVDKLGNCGIDCAYEALLRHPDLVEVAKSAHIPLNAWTVDSPQAAQELCALGVDFITTNAAY